MALSERQRVLLLFAHPVFARSRANRALLAAARGVAGVTIHELYEAYPDFDVDVDREQELLLEHDVVVLQHPFYWYSTPPLVKQWEDLVLEHGWAYGSTGTALHGKVWMNAITTGGSEEAYCATGQNRFTVRELLRPLEQTAVLCGMRFLPPFVVHGTLRADDRTLSDHAARYARALQGLRDGAYDPAALAGAPCLPVVLPEEA